jgi:hypothetical protein
MGNKANSSVLIKRGGVGALVAASINFLIFFISRGVGVSYMMPPRTADQQPMELPAMDILASSVIPAIVGTILLLILNRYTQRPLRFFLIIAVIVLVVSFIPLILIELPVNTKVLLGVMHLAAAGAIILFLRSAYE